MATAGDANYTPPGGQDIKEGSTESAQMLQNFWAKVADDIKDMNPVSISLFYFKK